MYAVSSLVTFAFSFAAVIVFTMGASRISGDRPNARGTVAAAFGLFLFGIVAATILFGFFSI